MNRIGKLLNIRPQIGLKVLAKSPLELFQNQTLRTIL